MKIKALFFLNFLIILTILFTSVSFVNAQENPKPNPGYVPAPAASNIKGQADAFRGTSGLQSAEAKNIVASIIKTALSLLGIIFLILMIFSGYQWMMAGGNEEQITTAKGRIKNAVIGIIIVVMAYAITAFIFKNLPGGSNQVQTTDPQNL
ncbi:hypothetical protein CVU82_03905 [Candidatus Falkowbacteria bacterium HGW-Falkowbacteria-1]|jgi:hypothetical protein|uniref:Uncharacterized protein n=1 Tax=Candidatus Falkowbacteria bacterium HGW-Falkowbacteria-1 TaxID=2013768 RepID=A0A2N2E908_9BACT|nr:MAG: hypothetical protein CVU82_03905 [Candidatus Falkowbacteria bacterium HGW-Falkowbacteria-1]